MTPVQAPAPTVTAGRAKATLAGPVKVKEGSHRRLEVLSGIVVDCPTGGGACTGTAGVSAAAGRGGRGSSLPKDLGDAGLSVPAGGSERVAVKLSRAASEALLADGRLGVRIAVSLTAPGTAPVRASRQATLQPPKPPPA
jgi:hypothetical protein